MLQKKSDAIFQMVVLCCPLRLDRMQNTATDHLKKHSKLSLSQIVSSILFDLFCCMTCSAWIFSISISRGEKMYMRSCLGHGMLYGCCGPKDHIL